MEIIKQKLKFYGEPENIESIAKLYFEGLGYDVCYSKDLKYLVKEKEYQNKKPFEDLITISKEKSNKGIPDLIIIKKDYFSFVEVKKSGEMNIRGDGDSLRESQLLWINNHPSINIIVFILSLDIEPNIQEEIRDLRKQLKSHSENYNKIWGERNELTDKINLLNKEVEELKRKEKIIKDKLQNQIERNLPVFIKRFVEETLEGI